MCSRESIEANMFADENLLENYSHILITSRPLKFKSRISSFFLILYGDVVALQLIKETFRLFFLYIVFRNSFLSV